VSAWSTASAGALFHQELAFTAVWSKHAVPDKSETIAYEHPDLAQFLRKLHTGGNHLSAGGLSAHDFK
jgi:hypothetical protein